jgi:hypothetical protein
MKKLLSAFVIILVASPLLLAQAQSQAPAPASVDDYSGMYTFLQEGEFVQVSVEDQGKVTGFVSRYGDGESDRGAFLDQFFKDGRLNGQKLSFTTETVHGVWYEFKGTAGRGAGKTANDEGYYVLKGKLVENIMDANKKIVVKSREVVFKSFPRDLDSGSEPSPAPPQ